MEKKMLKFYLVREFFTPHMHMITTHYSSSSYLFREKLTDILKILIYKLFLKQF